MNNPSSNDPRQFVFLEQLLTRLELGQREMLLRAWQPETALSDPALPPVGTDSPSIQASVKLQKWLLEHINRMKQERASRRPPEQRRRDQESG